MSTLFDVGNDSTLFQLSGMSMSGMTQHFSVSGTFSTFGNVDVGNDSTLFDVGKDSHFFNFGNVDVVML